MTNNTTKNNTYQQELKKQRKQWHETKLILEQQKNNLGYKNVSLKELADEEFSKQLLIRDIESTTLSALIDIGKKYKDLCEQYKILWPEEYVIHELNKKHAVVHLDQTYILTEKENLEGGKEFTIESRPSFINFYEDERIQCSDGKIRCKAIIWLKSPKRRKYIGITFDPATVSHVQGYYNIWKGFAKKPIKGNISLFWAHVRDNICNKNNEHYRYVRKWLAYVFQKPHEVHTALVLCGSQGVGKNSFVEPLGVLLGQHYVLLSSIAELVSNFNYHLKTAVLIHANEALWGGNKKEIGTVKAMITERNCLIESKGKDRIMVKNFKHIILSSNEDWPVHLDPDDRRFFVLRVSEEHKEDRAYFKAIEEQLENGGYEALLYDLLHEDLNNFEPRTLPSSPNAFAIKMRSTDSPYRYIYDALNDGYFDLCTEGYAPWPEQITRPALYKHYTDWCKENGEKEEKQNLFCTAIKKCIPSIKDRRLSMNGKRPRAYAMPSLEQARIDFCKVFKEEVTNLFLENEKREND
jgi:hypothetical protein